MLIKVLRDTEIDGQAVEANAWVYCNDEHAKILIAKGEATDKGSEASNELDILTTDIIEDEKPCLGTSEQVDQHMVEPSEKTIEENEQSKLERLGFLYDVPGVDPENIGFFAKIGRVSGLILTVSLVLWGLFYDWNYYRGPFEQFMREIGVRGSENRLIGAWVMGALIMFLGLKYRFQIGMMFFTSLFGIFNLAAKLFRKI